MKTVFVFGNGNTSFEDFKQYYEVPLTRLQDEEAVHFIVCDFRGTDTLAMEFLKTKTPHVSIYHIGEQPRYMPDKFKTQASEWKTVGGFRTDKERDNAAITQCTHFLAIDFNTDAQRKSGTQKNMEQCIAVGKFGL